MNCYGVMVTQLVIFSYTYHKKYFETINNFKNLILSINEKKIQKYFENTLILLT
jgi:deoxyribodipyrimidine photolyase-like uncharacterized protein